MTLRICTLLAVLLISVGGKPALAQYAQASGTISATATVSQPIGLVAISSTTAGITDNATIDHSYCFALLSPRLGGISLSIDNITIDLPRYLHSPRPYDLLRLVAPEFPAAPQVGTLIYTEN